jgi:hypothetical protein
MKKKLAKRKYVKKNKCPGCGKAMPKGKRMHKSCERKASKWFRS